MSFLFTLHLLTLIGNVVPSLIDLLIYICFHLDGYIRMPLPYYAEMWGSIQSNYQCALSFVEEYEHFENHNFQEYENLENHNFHTSRILIIILSAKRLN